jgi:hypothetical protein
MKAGIIRWSFYLAALLVLGPLAAGLLGRLRAPDGGPDFSPLVSMTPGEGLLYAFLALLIAAIVAFPTARICGLRPGLTAAGLVMAWAAWQTGTVEGMIRTAQSGGPLVTQAIEGAVLAGLGLLLTVGLSIAAIHEFPTGRRPHPTQAESAAADPNTRGASGIGATIIGLFTGKGGLLAIPAAVVAGGIVAALVAATGLKGQAVMAAVFGSLAAAAVARLVDIRASYPQMFLAVLTLAVVGPLTGLAAGAGPAVVRASYAGELFPLAHIAAMDWLAGGLLGLPLGAAWASSMVEKRLPG